MEARNIHQVVDATPLVGLEDRLRLLINTGLLLSCERNLDLIVQAALDAGLALCGAAYGAFFYNVASSGGETYRLYKTSPGGAQPFADLPVPRFPAASLSIAHGDLLVRSDDITADPRFEYDWTLQDRPKAQQPVRSYLAAHVRGRAGDVLGALVYGHPECGIFQPEGESLVATIASQTAVAIENVRLTESLTQQVALAEAARAEQRTTDRRLRQALDAVQLGTWMWHASSGLIDMDQRAAELFEVPAHTPISRNELWEQKVLNDDRLESPKDLQAVLDSGVPYAAEYRILLTDGSLRWIAASGIPALEEGTGKVIGMTGTVQDISGRKFQEESLRQSEKLAATGRLAATIAHEINNPLEAVTNLIYLAKTDPTTPAPVQRLLATADSELARVSQIAQQTLGFYRDTTHPVTIDLNELLGAVVDLFERKLMMKRLQVTLDLDPDLSVVGLQGEIRQVISNLLVNAIDASPNHGSSIRIRGRHRSRGGRKGISLLISDKGSGIPTHVRSRLFTPFVTTKQSSGTGLGLWVTRGMVEKHGGSVRFRSCTKDPAGTVFWVYLPQSSSEKLFASPSSAVLQ